MSWNVQGMCIKIEYLNVLAENYNFYVITVSEHWFKANNESTFVNLPSFITAAFLVDLFTSTGVLQFLLDLF